MKRLAGFFLPVLLAMTLPTAAEWSDPNVAGAKEYRLIRFYPQASVFEYDAKEFDSAKMLIAYKAGDDNPAVFDDVEGRVIRYQYQHKPSASILEIQRNYENVLKAKGFEPIISGHAGSFPGANANLPDDGWVSFWRWEEPGKGMIWINATAWYNGTDNPQSTLTIVESKAMQQALEANAATEKQASSLATALKESGRVAVYGVAFDFNKATLRPEATPVLDQVKALLVADPALSLTIEGHTDSVGQPAYNQKLSSERAEAVKTFLVAHGVSAARLTAKGFGDGKPVADNATEDGRSRNRRVELARP